jgi:hypothetical protein
MTITTRQILGKIGCKSLSLHKGEGYWYYTYYDGSKFFERSVYVFRLNHMSLSSWVEEGRALVATAAHD